MRRIGRAVAVPALVALAAIGCPNLRDQPPQKPAAAGTADSTPVIAPAPAPVPAPVRAPAPRPKPRPAPPTVALAGPSAAERARRDSAARADSLARAGALARESARMDSIARAQFVSDSTSRAAFVHDSLARVAFVHDSLTRDSLARDAARRDSLARETAARDSARAAAERDSLYGPEGAMPRIQDDPHITKPTATVQLSFVKQMFDNYDQIQFSYARPFMHKQASWEIDIPFQHWDSVGGSKTVNGPANINLSVNKTIVDGAWRQIASIGLQPDLGSVVNTSIGNNQWIVQLQYSISHWFADDRLHFRFMPYWQYGFAVDTAFGTKQKNVIVPRLVISARVTPELNATLDWRPRFDLTRNEYYATLMGLLSRPLPWWDLGVQAGYEVPLDSLAKRRVELQKLYITVSKTF